MLLIDVNEAKRQLQNSKIDDPTSGSAGWRMAHNVILDILNNLPTVDALPLRCRIGDEVWVVGRKCLSGLYDEECQIAEDCGVDVDCDTCHLDREYMVFSRKVDGVLFLYIHDLDDNKAFRWGETVFKTKEEAEAALAKMGGEKNG